MHGADLIPPDWDKQWEHKESFLLTTSGSTGTPKVWILEQPLIQWSAGQTLKHFIQSESLHQLIALPLSKVGGFMQWARAKTWKSTFDVVIPSSNPLKDYKGTAAIGSFTPMQLEHILEDPYSKNKLFQFHTILLGGSSISAQLESRLIHEYPSVNWIHTFGMTETYSHFAGRKLGQTLYQIVDETEIDQNEMGLMIKNPCTKDLWIQTHDLVDMHSPNQFLWIGRNDFTINSGGIKIQLETVEKEIEYQTHWHQEDFFCWWEEDDILGQKLVLYTKKTVVAPKNWKFSSRYFTPKKIYQMDQFILSENGKIMRSQTAASIQKKTP
jgi:O-succinylbenzoic acid--CoA ligase